MRFTHETLGQRVVLEPGGAVAQVVAEVERLGARRVALVASGSAAAVSRALAAELPVVLRWDEVARHVPVALAARARTAVTTAAADLLVCVGGGSAVGLAKAVALTSGLPVVAVPTTYAGSEATPVWGLTEDGVKRTGVDRAVLPVSVVYDPHLLRGLPAEVAVASGFNALAHCVDSLWAPATDPVDVALALEGARALARHLPRVAAAPDDTDGVAGCLYGAYLAGVAFASAGSGLHHKVCHVLGGMFDLPHAQTHAVVLPHVLAFNAPAVPELATRLAEALGGDGGGGPVAASAALAGLRRATGAPRSLRGLGMPETGVAAAVPRVLDAAPASNPRPVTRTVVEELLRAAWEGEEP